MGGWLGERRSITAIPRRRRTPIRRGEETRARGTRARGWYRRFKPRREKRPRDWVRAGLIERLLSLPPVAEFNLSEFARSIGAAVRSVSRELTYLEERGMVERLDARGGRGRGAELRIDHLALARRARSEKTRTLPPHTPLSPETDLHPASPVALRAERSASRLKSKSAGPPDRGALRSEFRRIERSGDPARRDRGWLRLIRRVAWHRGCEFAHSRAVSGAAGAAAASVGKGSKREAYLRACMVRVLNDPAIPPASWPVLVRWLAGAPEWYAHWSLKHEPQSRPNNPAEPQQRAGAPVARGAARGAQDAAGASGVRPRPQDRQHPAQLAFFAQWAERMSARVRARGRLDM